MKLAAAPSGRPDAWRDTVLTNSFTPVIWMVVVAVSPCCTVPAVGLADMVKSGAGATVSV